VKSRTPSRFEWEDVSWSSLLCPCTPDHTNLNPDVQVSDSFILHQIGGSLRLCWR
jgi:hypothetical protein